MPALSPSNLRQNIVSLAQAQKGTNQFSPDNMASKWASNKSNDGEESKEDKNDMPTEAHLVLLCLDHLRDLRRNYSDNSNDLNIAEGLDGDYITLAIWALSRSFTRPRELVRHKTSKNNNKTNRNDDNDMGRVDYSYLDRPYEYGNDAFFQPEYSHLASVASEASPIQVGNDINAKRFRLTDKIRIPSMQDMENEFLYRGKPRRTMDELISSPTNNKSGNDSSPEKQSQGGGGQKGLFRFLKQQNDATTDDENLDRSSWYEYEDSHYSNLYRFYSLNGLASTPLTLSYLASMGLKNARSSSRGKAEALMVTDELFTQFVDAVDSKGFFKVSEEEIVHRCSIALTTEGDRKSTNVRRGNNEIVIPPKQKRLVREQINEERYRKVLSKYRSKLAAQTIQDGDEEGRNGQEAEQFEKRCPSSNDGDEDDEERLEDENYDMVPKQYRNDSLKNNNNNLPNRGGTHMQELREKYRHREDTNYDEDEDNNREEDGDEDEDEEVDVDEEEDNTYITEGDDATIMPASFYAGLSSGKDSNDDDTTTKGGIPDDILSFSHGENSTKLSIPKGEDNNYNTKTLKDAERFKSLGNVQMQRKNFDQAEVFYSNALKLVPDGPSSHVYFSNRAAALLSVRKFRDAVLDSERSLALKPDYAKAHARLGLAYFLLGEYKEATDSYTLAVKYEPGNKMSLNYLEKSRKKYMASLKYGGDDNDDDISYRSGKQGRNKKSSSRQNKDGETSKHNQPRKSERLTKLLEMTKRGSNARNKVNKNGTNSKSSPELIKSSSEQSPSFRSSPEEYHSSSRKRPSLFSSRKRPSLSPERRISPPSSARNSKLLKKEMERLRKHSSQPPEDEYLSSPAERGGQSKNPIRSRFEEETSPLRTRLERDPTSPYRTRSERKSKSPYRTRSGQKSKSPHRARSERQSKSPHRMRLEQAKKFQEVSNNNKKRHKIINEDEDGGDDDEYDKVYMEPSKNMRTSDQKEGDRLKARLKKSSKKRDSSNDEDRRGDYDDCDYDDNTSHHSRRKTSESSKSRRTPDQKEADRLKGEGNRQMSKREYEKAIKSYSKALRICPAGPNSHVYFSNRAAAMCYLERYEEAELDSERSLALKPEYGKAHARLGLSRYFLKDYGGAVEAYEAALLYDPDNVASRSYLTKARVKYEKVRRGSRRG